MLSAGRASADTCSANGIACLFVDSSGCAITCDARCWVTTGGCTFGFGYDAICRCHDVKKCKTSCQKALGSSAGTFGLAVSSALTNCEVAAANAGRHGGDCYFDPAARNTIETARAQALEAVRAECTDQDVFDCFGIATVDDLASRLLKNTESSYAGVNKSVFDSGPADPPKTNKPLRP